MKRSIAREIAQNITNYQLYQMFVNAKNNINDWTVVSTCNKGCSKGVAWNILAKDFNVEHKYHNIAKINMIREFGEYLPEELKPEKKSKEVKEIKVVHHEPNFYNYN